MDKYKYTVIGSFATGEVAFGGQTMKTRNFTEQLEIEAGKDRVLRIDTKGWKKHPIRLCRNIKEALCQTEEIVIMPADRGINVIPRVLLILKGNNSVKTKYVVVGGWLPNLLKKKQSLQSVLKKFDSIYVETNLMKTSMEEMNFENVKILPNFKKLNILAQKELVFYEREPFRFCTFSRVLKEKGIEDAIEAIKAINTELGKTVCCLDIYGKVDDNQVEWFTELKECFPEYIQYKGLVDGTNSTEIIKNYFILLFPTYYSGEGYPGTLLDAFSAGVPVIASDWAYNTEIVNDELGFIFPARNVEALKDIILYTIHSPREVNKLKTTCIEYADKMKPEKVITTFIGD